MIDTGIDQRFEAYFRKDAESDVLKQVKTLPTHLKEFGFFILDRNKNGKKLKTHDSKAYQAILKKQKALYLAFDKLAKKDKILLIQSFTPSISDEILLAYELEKQLSTVDYHYARLVHRVDAKSPESIERAGRWLNTFLYHSMKFAPEHLTVEWIVINAVSLQEIDYWSPQLYASLIASTICTTSAQSNTVYELLKDIVINNKKGTIAGPSKPILGQHVIQALLMANKADGWQLIMNMLLAAQRQEGLRKEIMESIIYANPNAWPLVFDTIIKNKLTRFSSISQSMIAYLGFEDQEISNKDLNQMLSTISQHLNKKQTNAIWKSTDPQTIYTAIWALGLKDSQMANAKCRELIASKSVEVRFSCLYYSVQTESSDNKELLHQAIQDSDTRVSTFAINALNQFNDFTIKSNATLDATYARLEQLLPTAPEKSQTEKPIVWPWMTSDLRKETVAWVLIRFSGKRSPLALLKHKDHFTPDQRAYLYGDIIAIKPRDDAVRAALIEGLSDRSSQVCQYCIQGFKKIALRADELLELEALLRRKNNDVRNKVIKLIIKQDNDAIYGSAERLLASSNINSRNAGIEMLRRLTKKKRHRSQAQSLITKWADSTKTKITDDQQTQIDKILSSEDKPETMDDALGLLSGKTLTKAIAPKPKKVTYFSAASIEVIKQLDALVHEHALVETDKPEWGEEQLLGNSFINSPKRNVPVKNQLSQLPLADIWIAWLKARPASTRDSEGLELIRARLLLEINDHFALPRCIEWIDKEPARAKKIALPKEIRVAYAFQHARQVASILAWLSLLDNTASKRTKANDFILDSFEDIMSMVTPEEQKHTKKKGEYGGLHEKDWRYFWTMSSIYKDRLLECEKLTKPQLIRRYQLLHWHQQPIPKAQYLFIDLQVLLEGCKYRVATDDDLIFNLLSPHTQAFADHNALQLLTKKGNHPIKAELLGIYPRANEIVERCRDRILEIELKRGEEKTAASEAAGELQSVFSASLLVQLLQLLGKDGFSKTSYWGTIADDRKATFTQLIKNCYPNQNETTEDIAKLFKLAIKENKFPEERLMQLGFAAPQWINAVEQYYGWPGLREGYYWFYAHMKYMWHGIGNDALDDDNGAPSDTSNANDTAQTHSWRNDSSRWNRLVQERTDISELDRAEGVVDINWFHKTRENLTTKQWDAIAAAARYASTPAQAKHAALIAQVLTGKANRKSLIVGINERKLKDNVRLLGLLPIAAKKDPQKDVLERYEILQDYRQYANKLSSMSKPEALRAVQIGFDNLARTAGYNDPMRLAWALEAPGTKDLAAGFIEITKGDLIARLDLQDSGKPTIEFKRNDRVLKSLPASHKKDADIIQLRERAKEIKKQHSRSRATLEEAMNRQFTFTGRELQALSEHTLLWPMLSKLVFVGKDVMGYPDKKGKKLRSHNGTLQTVRVNDAYQIAHAHHFLTHKQWPKWQKDCFDSDRQQPFKQVFRELYPLSAQEKKDKIKSSRYAGHQLNPKQAKALWGNRGWHTQDGTWKSFPDRQITVSVEFDYDAGDIGNIHADTLSTISFHRHDTHEPIKLLQIDPILYSEVMRDIDLVVSVAHVGEVDPEASASSVEMRLNLLRETSSLLRLKNVELKKNHAIIKGTLGTYSIHLGSGVVHQVPGGHVCIVPVHSQHRGRLFLPFADDDPKTAEIITKVITLANDDEIKDPTILMQLQG